mgnify:CR=1 FL=1
MDFSRPQKILIAVGLSGVLCGVVLLSLQRLTRPTVPAAVVYTPPPTPLASTRSQVAVHVAGEVRQPGLYWLRPGARVADAIQAAGGQTAAADMSSINLAALLQDGAQVTVARLRSVADTLPTQPVAAPNHSPAPQPVPAAQSYPARPPLAAPASATITQPSVVSLNQATPQQLEALPGIGQELARRILYYRYEHGGFRSVDQLAEIDGIGPQRLKQLRPYVRP